MKLRALTNIKPKINKKKQTKKTKPKVHYVKDRLLPLSLTLELSSNYKGIADSIGGILNDLPIELKTLFSNSEIKSTVLRQGYHMFVLDNKFTFIIKDVTLSNKTKQEITIKHGKKRVFSTTI